MTTTPTAEQLAIELARRFREHLDVLLDNEEVTRLFAARMIQYCQTRDCRMPGNVHVLPPGARGLLTHNNGNRPLVRSHVRLYQSLFESAQWLESADSIIFTHDGMDNGQHRLTGLSRVTNPRAGGYPFAITFGYNRADIQLTVDQGRLRTFAQVLGVTGYKVLAEVVRGVGYAPRFRNEGAIRAQIALRLAEIVEPFYTELLPLTNRMPTRYKNPFFTAAVRARMNDYPLWLIGQFATVLVHGAATLPADTRVSARVINVAQACMNCFNDGVTSNSSHARYVRTYRMELALDAIQTRGLRPRWSPPQDRTAAPNRYPVSAAFAAIWDARNGVQSVAATSVRPAD